MKNKFSYSTGILVLILMRVLLPLSSVNAENGTILIEDSFDTLSGDWQPVYLEGSSSGGSYSVSSGQLNVSVTGPDKIYAVYNTTPFTGHFYAEVEFTNDDHCGLALIRKQSNGQPDTNNFTSIRVSTNGSGKVVVAVRDR